MPAAASPAAAAAPAVLLCAAACFRHPSLPQYAHPLSPTTTRTGAPAAQASVNQPSNCKLKVGFASSVYFGRNQTVSGSLTISNPTKSPLPVSWTPVLAVTSTVPKGASWRPPPAEGLGYGKLRPYRPYSGPFDVEQAILELPLDKCLPGASADKPAYVQPGQSVTCAFATPAAAAVAGTAPKTVAVSVSFDASAKGGAAATCAADAKTTVAA
jgi:hypothetical protein